MFGSPKVGTPLMLAVPDIALDLPLKILIAEKPDGATTVAFNSVPCLQARYGLSPEAAASFAALEHIAAAVAH